MSKQKKDQIFGGASRGEAMEVKQDLVSGDKNKQIAAMKMAIAMQTVGTEIGMLFPDIVNLFHTTNYEMKKLVYMFMINFAHGNPDKVMEAVGPIQRDCRDQHPFMRALALRTLASIRSPKIIEYVITPLRDSLKDNDPYVRKTAAVCVPKLFAYQPTWAEEQHLVDSLRELISDANPMVVANAVAGLAEISAVTGDDVFEINAGVMAKLLAALNECTEWGQVFILDSLATYRPGSEEAERVIERVIPRLQHENSAVQLAAIRVIVNLLSVIENEDLENQVLRTKLPPPLITLLSESQPEMQYVALRNINLIVQRWPNVLTHEVKHFFCKYNDPSYIKMEKLEILINLVTADSIEEVLMEFSEYAKEVDVNFVRKSVMAIGRCAIKLEEKADDCVQVLQKLLESKVTYVVQEGVSVIKDILRKYPGKYEGIIATLCENLDSLDEPPAKASMIWIIGEYSARIENVPLLLEDFVDTFPEETPEVQLAMLTAVVKFFLRRPDEAKEMVTKVLDMATQNADNPDLRDRGYVYWRLLSTDPKAAANIVLAQKPTISETSFAYEKDVLRMLLANIGTLASVYHKPPEKFVKGGKTLVFADESSDSDSSDSSDSDESDDDESKGEASATPTPQAAAPAKSALPIDIDFLGDVAGDMNTHDAPSSKLSRAPIVLTADNPKCPGLAVRAEFDRDGKRPVLGLFIENGTGKDIHNVAIKFNKNFFGVNPTQVMKLNAPAYGSGEATVPIGFGGVADQGTGVSENLQVAIKTEVGVAFFVMSLDIWALFENEGQVDQKSFIQKWKALGADEKNMSLSEQSMSADSLVAKLQNRNVFLVARRDKGDRTSLFCSLKVKDTEVLLEVVVGDEIVGNAKCEHDDFAHAALMGVAQICKQ